MNYNAMIQQDAILRNHEGAAAFKVYPEMELYSAVVTTAMCDNFYEDRLGRAERIAKLIREVSPLFVAQLAVYARTEMNLRTVPLFLLVELAKVHSGDSLVSRAVAKAIQRPDEIMELLTCYQWRNPSEGFKKLGKLSRQIQNGLQQSFNHFDEYGFAKYNRDNREVKLRDALFLVHPKAKDDAQQALFDKIAKDELEVPYTWEVELSVLGQQSFESSEEKEAAVRAKWEELIANNALGYMALLRNLRNILQAKVSDAHISSVCRRLADPESVRKSKQFPFRFLSAYREVKDVESMHTAQVLSALERAVAATAPLLQGFDEHTRAVLASDVSGSMWRPVSPKSKVQNYDIGILLSMLLKSHCHQVYSGIFGDTWKVVNMPAEGILANTISLSNLNNQVGFSTNGYKVIDWLIENDVITDKVMMFTDCQMWNSHDNDERVTFHNSWKKYKAMAPEAKLYLFDLCGYGQSPVSLESDDVCLIAGWSDKVFDILDAIEHGESALDTIRNIEI